MLLSHDPWWVKGSWDHVPVWNKMHAIVVISSIIWKVSRWARTMEIINSTYSYGFGLIGNQQNIASLYGLLWELRTRNKELYSEIWPNRNTLRQSCTVLYEVQIWTDPEAGVIHRNKPNTHDRWGSTRRHCITAYFFPSLLDSSCLISDFSLVDQLQPTLFPSYFCLTSFWWTFQKNTNHPGHGALPKCWGYSRLLSYSFTIFYFHVTLIWRCLITSLLLS